MAGQWNDSMAECESILKKMGCLMASMIIPVYLVFYGIINLFYWIGIKRFQSRIEKRNKKNGF